MPARGRLTQLRVPGNCTAKRHFAATVSRPADFTHAIIGGGVVGLAVGRALASRSPPSGAPPPSVLLLERHRAVGTETSSRSSEVIHAGLYYGTASLKARLCVRGAELLYALCDERGVPHRRTGKWIVAQTAAQREALERVRETAAALAVPVRWVSKAEARRREPAVRAEAGALESPRTGIVDSHALTMCLLGLFEAAGGTVALGSVVEGVAPMRSSRGGGREKGGGSSPLPGSGGWELRVRDAATGDASTISAETIVNSAGLGAVAVHNMIVPKASRLAMHYAKGNYFSYSAPKPRVGTLVYPAPEPGLGGLGTHLTLDLSGRMRFGPDVEWVGSADYVAASAARLPQAVAEIRKYLPDIDADGLAPDYAGIRPKLAGPEDGKGFVDFVVRKEDGYEGWVNLLGIESPGLTSSLAIAEMVEQLLYS